MGRKILGGVLGAVLAMVAIIAVEFGSMQIWPPPPGIDVHSSPEAAKAYHENLPVGARLGVIAAWAAGGFVAGITSAGVARSRVPALVLGVLLTAACIYNMVVITSPWWFWALGLVAALPTAWLGSTLVVKKGT